MNKFIYVLLMLCFPLVAKSQTITGKVVDPEGQAIDFANIILCNDADSTMVSGCTSDLDGLFTLECPNKEGKHIQVSFVGYET